MDDTPRRDGQDAPPTEAAELDLFGKPSPTGTWEHRRGEPRAFVFLWVGFLVIATLATLIGSSAAGVFTPESFRPNARLLLEPLFVVSASEVPRL